MTKKLLADRFQLKFHLEKKETSVYAIRIDKTAKLTESQADPNGLPTTVFGRTAMGATYNVRNATLATAAGVLQAFLDKPLADQTGLSKKYDFTLTFTPDPAQAPLLGGSPAAADNPDAAPDLFTAFRQQLGLKLEPTKASVDLMVIDKVERPSPN